MKWWRFIWSNEIESNFNRYYNLQNKRDPLARPTFDELHPSSYHPQAIFFILLRLFILAARDIINRGFRDGITFPRTVFDLGRVYYGPNSNIISRQALVTPFHGGHRGTRTSAALARPQTSRRRLIPPPSTSWPHQFDRCLILLESFELYRRYSSVDVPSNTYIPSWTRTFGHHVERVMNLGRDGVSGCVCVCACLTAPSANYEGEYFRGIRHQWPGIFARPI